MSSVQSIRRAFDVLSALGSGPLGVTEVAERARLPKSTAARLLATLAREGAVEQVPGETQYRLGPRLATLAAGLTPIRSIVAVARPTLEELAAASGEAAGLAVPDGDLAHYIDQVSTPNPVSVRDWTGSRVPLHAVSSGQVLLAFQMPAAVSHYLARPLEGFTPRTLVEPEARARSTPRDPPRRLRVGTRGIRRGDLVRRRADRRRVRRGRSRAPRARSVVPLPASRPRGSPGRAGRDRRGADRGRVAAGLRPLRVSESSRSGALSGQPASGSAVGRPASGSAGGRLAVTGSRSIVRTWRVLPASVRTTADGMTPETSFSMTAVSPA